jgi:putative FmdB family regulatory protein
MPIYEYRCGACGHTLDALQKLADAPLKDCPECDEPSLKRLMSAPSFRLKGGGWYETDFKSEKEKKRNLADGAERKAGEDKPSSADSATKAESGSKSTEKSAEKGAEKGAGKSGDDNKGAAKKDGGSGAKTAAA